MTTLFRSWNKIAGIPSRGQREVVKTSHNQGASLNKTARPPIKLLDHTVPSEPLVEDLVVSTFYVTPSFISKNWQITFSKVHNSCNCTFSRYFLFYYFHITYIFFFSLRRKNTKWQITCTFRQCLYISFTRGFVVLPRISLPLPSQFISHRSRIGGGGRKGEGGGRGRNAKRSPTWWFSKRTSKPTPLRTTRHFFLRTWHGRDSSRTFEATIEPSYAHLFVYNIHTQASLACSCEGTDPLYKRSYEGE